MFTSWQTLFIPSFSKPCRGCFNLLNFLTPVQEFQMIAQGREVDQVLERDENFASRSRSASCAIWTTSPPRWKKDKSRPKSVEPYALLSPFSGSSIPSTCAHARTRKSRWGYESLAWTLSSLGASRDSGKLCLEVSVLIGRRACSKAEGRRVSLGVVASYSAVTHS